MYVIIFTNWSNWIVYKHVCTYTYLTCPTRGSFFFEKYLPWASCVVLLCLSVLLCCFAFLSKYLMDDWVMYILGLVFGVLAGLITAAFSFIPSLNSPVYLVLILWGALVSLYCICDSSPANWAASVAQLVRASPNKLTVMGSNPTRAWVSCVVLLCFSVVLCCFAFLSISWMIEVM